MSLALRALALLCICLCCVSAAPASPHHDEERRPLADLGSYWINPEKIHASGISAGAYFAVQFAIAHSSLLSGAGSIAGGPYYCAQGSVSTALTSCMSTPSAINVNNLVKQTQTYSQSGAIDNVENLRNHRNYLFAGKSDGTVNPVAGEKLETYWLSFQNSSQIHAEYSINAGHAHITDNFGNACTSSRLPYINDCDYDSAGVLLQHMYGGTLKPRGQSIASNLIKFDQSKYDAVSFQSDAYVYVPTGCQQGAQCGLHLAFHGCTMNSDNLQVREQYVASAGYNTWAEANNIIVLYPQASTSISPSNPNACFDWWGYGGSNYATKNGDQISAVKKMVDQLMSGGPTVPAPTGLSLVSVSNNSATISWTAIPEASGYLVFRNGGQVNSQPIAQTQYTDSGLSSGTYYEYEVAASVNGASGPRSLPLVVKTSGPAPPLAAPSLTIVSTTATSVSLTWSTLLGASGYTVRRGGVDVLNVTSTSYTDSGLQAETSYTYTVKGFTSTAFGPESNQVTARTGSSWLCQEYYDNNYNHVAASRATQRLGYVYALGSDEYMGLYNIATYKRLAETSADYFVIGNCPSQ